MNIVRVKKMFAVITVIFTTAAFALPASAADDVSICNEDANCITQIETLAAQIEEVSDEDAAKAVDSAKQAIQSSDIDLHLLDGKLDYKTFSVYRFRPS